METVIVRLEVAPESAATLARVVEQAITAADLQLSQDPPQHTRRALAAMRDHLQGIDRELTRAMANPLAVDVDGEPIKEEA